MARYRIGCEKILSFHGIAVPEGILASSHRAAGQGAPRLVFALGVPRSASTWVFNVLRLILAAKQAFSLYCDTAETLALSLTGRESIVVVKTHHPDAAMRLLINIADAPVFMTVRDPLDCVASLMTQFHTDFVDALAFVERGAKAALEAHTYSHPLLIRYESDARGEESITKIATTLGLALDPAEVSAVAAELSASRVKEKIVELSLAGVFGPEATPDRFDPLTHWHPNHLGTGKVGRHASTLTETQIDEVIVRTWQFRQTFAYQP